MTRTERALLQAVACWNAGDLDGYLALYAPQVRVHGYTPEPMNRAQAEDFYHAIWAGLSEQGGANPRLSIDEVLGAVRPAG